MVGEAKIITDILKEEVIDFLKLETLSGVDLNSKVDDFVDNIVTIKKYSK